MTATTQPTIWDDEALRAPHARADKAARVRAMFDQIAPTYERVNRVLSAGRDAAWRRKAVAMARVQPGDRVLDLACGTGDFSRAFEAAGPALVVGGDFAANMLALAAARGNSAIRWCRADAQCLPFPDGSFTIASCAFGVRNFQDLSRGLGEMHRVLAPGGRAVILEFTLPRSRLLGGAYGIYFRRVLPRLARLISRDRTGAYDYLPESVSSFLDAPAMAAAMCDAGFTQVQHRALTFGIVTVYVAQKPAALCRGMIA